MRADTVLSQEREVQTAVGANPPDHEGGEPRYSERAARAFDRACQLTSLSNSELCRRFTEMLGRRHLLSRQTLAAWRTGRQAVPLSAFVVAANLAGLRLRVIFALGEEGFDLSLIPPEARLQDGVPLRYFAAHPETAAASRRPAGASRRPAGAIRRRSGASGARRGEG